jgi:hypothetical protein
MGGMGGKVETSRNRKELASAFCLTAANSIMLFESIKVQEEMHHSG